MKTLKIKDKTTYSESSKKSFFSQRFLRSKLEDHAHLVKISQTLDTIYNVHVKVDECLMRFKTEKGATFALLLYNDVLEPALEYE